LKKGKCKRNQNGKRGNKNYKIIIMWVMGNVGKSMGGRIRYEGLLRHRRKEISYLDSRRGGGGIL
jgi:hypothetical protein